MIKYAIKLDGEYMHERFGEDCFTDDLSFAVLFDSREMAEDELIGREQVVEIHFDDEGGMIEK